MNGFDFGISLEGDLLINQNTHDILLKKDDELRIQLAYNRLKSVLNDWFMDECGADLEELIGKPCSTKFVEYGKAKITTALEQDDLWFKDEYHIYSQIKDDTHIEYSIFFRLTKNEEVYSYEMDIELDLVKGIKIKYGWNPRRV